MAIFRMQEQFKNCSCIFFSGMWADNLPAPRLLILMGFYLEEWNSFFIELLSAFRSLFRDTVFTRRRTPFLCTLVNTLLNYK